MLATELATPWLVLAPLMLVLAGLLGLPLLGIERPLTRRLVGGGVALVALAYGWWRIGTTIPWAAHAPALAFALVVLGVEMLAHFDSALLYAALLRRTDRRGEADRHEARLRGLPGPALPAVDVVIATYNEPLAVLEKTVIGALSLDWPDVRVWVADDGRRAWLRDWCIAKGAGYIIRPDNSHAKAGNINHALEKTEADFMAVLDADFVPQRNWLMRAMGFFEDETLGIVQVPHSFYNHDPMQQNLAMREAIPDDQRFFFEAIMPGRDGWDAAFCCGSNGIVRRAAMAAVGGKLPGGSITEDMLLTLVMLRKGYVTRYLNEPLAYGLAPESMMAFFVQRARWAQGGIQLLFLKEGPLGPGLRLRHRLFFMPTAWASQALMLMLALVSPLVFLFFDVPPLVGVTAESALFHLVPMVVAQVGGIVLLGGGRYYPIASLVLGTFQSFKLLPVILKTLWKPHGHAFKVTPKGSDAVSGGMERGIFIACLSLMLVTMAGLVINALPDWRIVAQGALVPMVAFWGALNVLVLFLAAMLCIGRPSPRGEERFAIDETVAVWRGGAGARSLALRHRRGGGRGCGSAGAG
jgi:cellulose synthase (UDP-forming)